MKLDSVWFLAVLAAIIVMIGQWNAKIAYSLAAIILLGAVVLNGDKFTKIMKGDFSG